MDLTKSKLFTALSQRMSWLRERQEILAQNIANANTPGYTARDIKPLSFRQLMQGPAHAPMTPRVTAVGHQVGGRLTPVQTYGSDRNRSAEPNLTGNAVAIEEEIMKVGETGMDYQTMTMLYRKHMDMLRTALGRGN